MAKKTKAQKDREFLLKARKRLKIAIDTESENREMAEEDVNFRHGDQWPEDVKKERDDDGRPCLTFNRAEGFIDTIVGDARQQKINIKIKPSTDEQNADILDGLINKIEYDSKADLAYQNAFDNAAGHGFGFFRIGTRYVKGSFLQECYFERILNPFNVHLDPSHLDPTGADCNWAFVSVYFDPDEFEDKYPDASGESDSQAIGEGAEDWFSSKVRVSEYFYRKPIKKKLYLYSDGTITNEKFTEDQYDKDGKLIYLQDERDDETHEVWRVLMSGNDILEEATQVPGEYIPIIKVSGKELNVKGKTFTRGAIRHAKDACRSYNYFRSASAESVGLGPRVPWMATAEQIEGYEGIWNTANTKNHSYLPYNNVPGVAPPSRVNPTNINQGAVQEAQLALDDMKGTTGIYDASMGASGNETSGKAILARQHQGDTATFTYHDNLALAVEQGARVLERMIPIVYDTERNVLVRVGEKESTVTINQQTTDGIINDLTQGHYDITAKTGPSYSTQRVEAREVLMQLVQVSPRLQDTAMDKVFDNLDFKGAAEIADRLRATMPKQVIDPTAPPPEPSPAEKAQMAEAEADMAKAEATKIEAQADIAKAQVEIKQAENEMMNDRENLTRLIEAVVTAELSEHNSDLHS